MGDMSTHVVCFDSDYRSLTQFLDEWKPSCVPFDHVEWLTVSNQVTDKIMRSVDTVGLLAAWESRCLSSLNRLTTVDIEQLAITHNVLEGKWLIFVNKDRVDEDWVKVARGVVHEGLAIDAKVSTAYLKPLKSGRPKEEKIVEGTHVICVWFENFCDIESVFALRARLRDLGFVGKLFYKPDAYTVCGVYKDNQLGLPAAKFCA